LPGLVAGSYNGMVRLPGLVAGSYNGTVRLSGLVAVVIRVW